MISFGNYSVNQLYLGSSAITSAFMGTTLIWPTNEYQYTFGTTKVYYSSGTKLLPTGTNYAYVMTSYVQKKRVSDGTTQVYSNVKLTLTVKANQQQYASLFTTSGAPTDLTFNIDDYGTTDIDDYYGLHGYDLGVTFVASYEGAIVGEYTIVMLPNTLESDEITGYISSGTCISKPKVIPWSGQNLTLRQYCKARYKRQYTSGQYETYDTDTPCYLYFPSITNYVTVTTSLTQFTISTGTNQKTPRLFRVYFCPNHDAHTSSHNDAYVMMVQQSKTNYVAGGLELYDYEEGVWIADGDTVWAVNDDSSAKMFIDNCWHEGKTYTFLSESTDVDIEYRDGGIIYLYCNSTGCTEMNCTLSDSDGNVIDIYVIFAN